VLGCPFHQPERVLETLAIDPAGVWGCRRPRWWRRRAVRGYRKTLRRNPWKPLATDLPPDPSSAEYPVRLIFLLPDTVLVSPSPHGFNTTVLPGNVVRIRGREARQCFALAREFFAVVAWDRAFTCRATITRDDNPRIFGRHLTVVRGSLVISGGTLEPRVYE
jgi:hypothetical protein